MEDNSNTKTSSVDLSVQLGRLALPNPVMVASGTFGYAKEIAGLLDLKRLGGIIPKTITREPRAGNPPPRTVETPAGLLNSIGLDNDGLDAFLVEKLPYLRDVGCPIIVSIAGQNIEDFVEMAAQLDQADGVDGLELNLSCPNVSHGVNFSTDPAACEKVVASVRNACSLPLLAKLTPNVADVPIVAKGAEAGGADAVSLINTCLGMAIDWRNRRPRLGNNMGGLSGPAIKPIAVRIVWQVAQAIQIPIVGIGGIETVDDAMEFFVAGASAIQVGTANFYRPTASTDILDGLPEAVASLGVDRLEEIVNTLTLNKT